MDDLPIIGGSIESLECLSLLAALLRSEMVLDENKDKLVEAVSNIVALHKA